MELHGETYLFNLSLLAITFTAVSALVMLVRQTMGGKLSNFDVYLIVTYVSLGFVIAVGALLPPLLVLFTPTPTVLWLVASGLTALLLASVTINAVTSRRKASPEPMSMAVRTTFTIHGIGVVLLIVNATLPPVQGVGLYATALTLSLINLFWAFVRRIASLLGDKPGEDWDPKRG